MVDADLTVQLLEANVSPACADALLPQFGEDFVQTILDPLFPPPPTVKTESTVKSGDFKRGLCRRGDSCRYSHNITNRTVSDQAVPAVEECGEQLPDEMIRPFAS